MEISEYVCAIMVKRALSVLLICLLLAETTSRLVVVAAFAMNRNYIAQNLCENREMPELNCDGQCYLAKKLKQAADKESQHEQETVQLNFHPPFITEQATWIAHGNAAERNEPMPEHPFLLPSFSFSIFHPPKS